MQWDSDSSTFYDESKITTRRKEEIESVADDIPRISSERHWKMEFNRTWYFDKTVPLVKACRRKVPAACSRLPCNCPRGEKSIGEEIRKSATELNFVVGIVNDGWKEWETRAGIGGSPPPWKRVAERKPYRIVMVTKTRLISTGRHPNYYNLTRALLDLMY